MLNISKTKKQNNDRRNTRIFKQIKRLLNALVYTAENFAHINDFEEKFRIIDRTRSYW